MFEFLEQAFRKKTLLKPTLKKAATFLLPLLFCGCSSFFYYPTRYKYSDPLQYKYHFHEISFESLDKTKLLGWYFPAVGKSKGTVIQFHGNAENMSSHFHAVVWMIKEGFDVFSFDYRGYGGSYGEPDPGGINKDAIAAVNFVNGGGLGKKPENLILYGQSLGGAILLGAYDQFADKSNIRLVIVEGSFLSYQGIAREKLSSTWFTWILQPLVYVTVSDKYSAKKTIQNISPVPLLVVHGTEDPVVPFSESKKIFEAAKEPKYFLEVTGGKHIDLAYAQGGKWKDVLLEKIKSIVKF